MTDDPPRPPHRPFRPAHRPLTREQAKRDLILEGVERAPWTEADRRAAARAFLQDASSQFAAVDPVAARTQPSYLRPDGPSEADWRIAADAMRPVSRSDDPFGHITSAAVRSALQRPLLPHTAAEIEEMLDEARDQLAPRPVAEQAFERLDRLNQGTGFSVPWMPERPDIDPLVNCTCGKFLGACRCEYVWREPELQNGWTVHHDGVVSTPQGTTVFVLPPDYRPLVEPRLQGSVDMCFRMLNP